MGWERIERIWSRRQAKAWLLAGTACVIVGAWLWLSRAPKGPVGEDWLVASTPQFGSRTNATGIESVVSFVVSNRGPRGVAFQIAWLECRAATDLSLLKGVADGLPGSVRLAPGASSEVVMPLTKPFSVGESPLFCCQLDWWEEVPPLLRAGRRLEPLVTGTMQIFDSQWVAPWDGELHLARGDVFVSSGGVELFFERVYGLTRTKWLEDRVRAEQARTNGPVFVERRYGLMPGRGPGSSERLESQATAAFWQYMQLTATNWTAATLSQGASGR